MQRPFQSNRFFRNNGRMRKHLVAVPGNSKRRVAVAVPAMIFALIFGTTYGVAEQSSVPNAMQGFSQNRDQPIQIEAASLEVRPKKKESTFSGNVKVVQGDTTMTSKSLVVFYESSQSGQAPGGDSKVAAPKSAPIKSATPGPGGSSSIKRLEARGDVKVVQKEQAVTGDMAVFDTKTNLITMRGGVVLTKCKNVMRGDRLLVDMTTGVSRVESDSGKVQVLVDRSSDVGCGTPSALPGSARGDRSR
jgi:lipopolysaccharide export system protein LptA